MRFLEFLRNELGALGLGRLRFGIGSAGAKGTVLDASAAALTIEDGTTPLTLEDGTTELTLEG